MGMSGMGCHAVSQRKMAMPPSRPTAPPASETTTASVSNCRRMRPRPRSEGHAYRDFSGAIGGASREQAAEVRTSRQQDEPGEEQEPRHKCPRRAPQHVSDQPRPRQRKLHAVVFARIRFGQRCADGIQIRGGPATESRPPSAGPPQTRCDCRALPANYSLPAVVAARWAPTAPAQKTAPSRETPAAPRQ